MIIEQELSSVKDNSQNIQTNKPKVLVLTPNKDNNIAALKKKYQIKFPMKSIELMRESMI